MVNPIPQLNPQPYNEKIPSTCTDELLVIGEVAVGLGIGILAYLCVAYAAIQNDDLEE